MALRLFSHHPINVSERIRLFRQTLGSNAPDELKAYDLVWLLHLIGDVYQPLHATSRFTQDGDKQEGDRGGNAVKLCIFPCRDELHSFWDDVLGTSKNVSAAIKAAIALPKADPALVSTVSETAWVQESFEVARREAYKNPIGAGNGPFTLTSTYKSNAKKFARKQAGLAAARLANLFNAELK